MSPPSSCLPSLPPWAKKRPATAAPESEGAAAAAAAAQQQQGDELMLSKGDVDTDDTADNSSRGKPRGKKKAKTGDGTSKQKQKMKNKRPHSSSTTGSPSSHNNRRRQRGRPPPPPAPPAVLVQLLQSDGAVLEYFQSLQANLQADVQIWKDRAQTYEKDKKQLQRQVLKLQKQVQQQQQNGGGTAQNNNNNKDSSSSSSRVTKKKKAKSGKKEASSSPPAKKNRNDASPSTATAAGLHHQEGVPIEDNMFDFDDDSDDDDESNHGKPHAPPTTKRKDAHDDTTKKKRAGLFEFEVEVEVDDDDDDDDDSCSDEDNDDKEEYTTISSKQNNKGQKTWLSDDDNDNDDDDNVDKEDWFQQEEMENEKEQVRQLLTEAYNILERLGVSLVDITIVDDADCNMDATTQQPESQNAAAPDTTVVANNTVAMDLDDDDDDDENKQQQQQNVTAATSTIQKHQQQPPPSPRVVVNNISPRTNEQVAADLMFALKSLSRIQMLDSQLMQSYPPFETTGLLPACNHQQENEGDKASSSSSSSSNSSSATATALMTDPLKDSEQKREHQQQDRPPHPLKEGKLLAFRALLILDTYCSPDMTDDDWDSYFVVANDNDEDNDNKRDNHNKMEEMRIGLRGRKQWVQQLVDSLHGEIAHFWAMQDRSLRLTTTALHFDPHGNDVMNNNCCSDDDKNNNEENGRAAHVEEYVDDGTTHSNGGDAGVSLYMDKKNQDEAKTKTILGGGKSQARLSSLLERVCLCQLVVGFYLSRNDPQTVAGLIRSYLLSTVPSVLSSNDNDKAEDYPKLPPVQSLVLVEAMLLPDAQMLWWLPASDKDNANDELSSIFDLVASLVVDDVNDSSSESTNQFTGTPVSTVRSSFNAASAAGVSLCIHATASVWKQRLASCDDRIHDMSRVELAAYERLLASKQAIRLGLKEYVWSASRLQQELADYYQVFSTENGTIGKTTIRAQGNYGHQLCLVVENRISRALPLSCFHRNDLDIVALRRVLVSWCIALRQLCIRRLDQYRAMIGPTAVNSSNGNEFVVSCRYMCDHIYSEPVKEESEHLRLLLSATLECCAILADGDTAIRCSWRLVELLNRNQSIIDPAQRQGIFDLFRIVGHMPLIRVINLERRKDRMRSFLCQCMAHEILVVRAVVDLSDPPTRATPENDSAVIPDDGYYFGRHAIDGSGRMVEAHERLVQAVGLSVPKLNSLVGTHWCPNDLKPFDRDAPNDERLVHMSCSERACALSHIASWKGVLRSLVLPQMDMSSAALLERRDRDTNKKLLSYPDRLRRVFRISGFASGQAMHAQNNGMHPVPVCVILEDDAILVDRFVDRLQALLLELPRDFHFCSLGYSRPKTAPIVPYTRNQRNHKCPCILGIPTNLFYLTGYILSQAGAEYLLSNLPVVGPVDSWIGLKMTSNWDNVYGHVLGVGSHANLSSAATTTAATAAAGQGKSCHQQHDSSPHPPVPIAHKELCQILNFRAFCAMQPLCSQRMMMTSTGAAAAATTSRSWRQRDTDIEYSGGQLPCPRP